MGLNITVGVIILADAQGHTASATASPLGTGSNREHHLGALAEDTNPAGNLTTNTGLQGCIPCVRASDPEDHTLRVSDVRVQGTGQDCSKDLGASCQYTP